MAQIFFNSFGTRATLAIWAFVVLAQYMMGSSMVYAPAYMFKISELTFKLFTPL
jgi:hypothetical protein